MIEGRSFIGNERSAPNEHKFSTFNPQLNADTPWIFYEVTTAELNQACQLAEQAFREYRKVSKERRADFLNAISKEIMNLGDSLIEVYCMESGLSKTRAIVERSRTIYQLDSLADYLRSKEWDHISIDRVDGNRTPASKSDIRKTYIPLGPIVVFGASNFPLAYSTAGGDTASALASGCPVIVKSHPMHAGTGELVAGAIIRAVNAQNMPNGVFSNLNIKEYTLAGNLVQKSEIKGVGFTGSVHGGRALFDLASRRNEPIPVFAEMGSINPIIITEKALMEKLNYWSETIADSMTQGAGQFCTNPGLIFLQNTDVTQEFISKLSEDLKNRETQCMLHPTIKESYRRLKLDFLNNTSIQNPYNFEGDDNFNDVTLLTCTVDLFLKDANLRREVFGPFTVIIIYDTISELYQLIDNIEGQLTGTIVAGEEETGNLQEIIDRLQQRVGRIIFNGVPTGVEVCPSMNHGGPYPASTDARFTAVGIDAVKRWLRPISFQNFPNSLLPIELRDE